MKCKLFFRFFPLTAFYLITSVLFPQESQTGSIKGRIIGSDDKKVLPYASVMVVGTNNGTATDLDGIFFLRNVLEGKQQLKVSYVGYKTKVQEITIQPNKTVELTVSLDPMTIESEVIVVTGQAQGQHNAINQQIQTNTIKNVVSPERLQENPDANAAEALGRLPGISLERSGGEGTGVVIRGLESKYSSVMLNGVELPSTDANDRSTGVSGLSQYVLQTVEVYKALTADMEANSVAGAINLKLAEAPDSLNYSIIIQGGYNNLNNYFGNYKIQGDISDRFFNGSLGAKLSLNAERVNRSRETMSAGYVVESNLYGGLQYEPVLLSSTTLHKINNIKEKQAATLVLDWKFNPTSKIFWYNFFSRSGGDYTDVSKTYNPLGKTVTYNINQDNSANDLLFSSSIRGEHSFDLFDVDYGIAFSQSHSYSPDNRMWIFTLSPGGYDDKYANNTTRMLQPEQIVALSNDNSDITTLQKIHLDDIGYSTNDLIQKNLTSYFDVKYPFNFGDMISGYIKGGAKYRQVSRNRNYLSAIQYVSTSPQFSFLASKEFDWATLPTGSYISAQHLVDYNVSDFLDGSYNFGWYPRIDLLNNLFNWWNNLSNYYYGLGTDAIIAAFGQYNKIGFTADYLASSINNQDIDEKYYATYLITEVKAGDVIMFLPGVRYEKVTDDLSGYYVKQTPITYAGGMPLTKVNARHSDEYLLPMIHLRVKPTDWMHIHTSYTQALGRPDYNALAPNTYVNNGVGSFVYSSGNPNLKPELWTNIDLQFAVYGNYVGMFSINGFYKEAKDKIWQRTYSRIKGDPVIPGFSESTSVSVSEWLNHQYTVYIRGAEFEWQTSFWYLPEPLNYFSLNVNYTFLKSETKYPTTRLYTTYEVDDRGRYIPTLHRVDSVATDNMINQPEDIVNISLGFNYRGLNAWLSFQYNGSMLTGWGNQRELIPYKDKFYRWDLQLTQQLPFEGLEAILNLANISDYVEKSKQKGDPRPTYIESYGWTVDVGLRYRL